MSKKSNSYVAKKADESGFVNYTDEENETWAILYDRQMAVIEDRACDEYFRGLEILGLPSDRVAQIPVVNKVLGKTTGWQLAPVAAVIPFGEFFELLADRKFPAATFIRRKEDIDYLSEPDIFHEIYGHCPLLTDPVFAEFVHKYGKLGVSADPWERAFLARLFWFTVEFGLINTASGQRIYGAGILSSKGETPYALEDPIPERRPFDVLTILRTSYRIDIFQTVYYAIDRYKDLYDIINETLLSKIQQAITLGMLEPTFPTNVSPSDTSDHHVC